MSIIKNYINIVNSLQSLSKKTTLIVVSKNQQLNDINLLIKAGNRERGRDLFKKIPDC